MVQAVDVEAQSLIDAKPVRVFLAEADAHVRSDFISKVLGIVLCQLIFTAVAGYGLRTQVVLSLPEEHLPLIAGLCSFFAVIMVLFASWCPSTMSSYPSNYAYLSIFTMLMTFVVSLVTYEISGELLLIAAGMTVAVFGFMLILASTIKLDLTGWWSFLVIPIVVLAFFPILALLLRILASSFAGKIMLVSCLLALGVFILCFGLFVVLQRIVRGDGRRSFTTDEYVPAAMLLYYELIDIFLQIAVALNDSR